MRRFGEYTTVLAAGAALLSKPLGALLVAKKVNHNPRSAMSPLTGQPFRLNFCGLIADRGSSQVNHNPAAAAVKLALYQPLEAGESEGGGAAAEAKLVALLLQVGLKR